MRETSFWKIVRRRGFTLVELLTVMVIIGILVGLITVAVIAARAKAKVAQVGVDIAGLEQALKGYRDKFGEYPPDCAELTTAPSAVRQMIRAAFVQHFSRAFPRYVITGNNTDQQWSTLQTLLRNQFSIDISYLDPASSLTFFLGGLPEIVSGQFTGRLIGFSANPTNPFDAVSASRIPPFFEFDPSRLVRTNRNWFRYQPPSSGGTQVPPYVYFRAPYYYLNSTQMVVLEWIRTNSAGSGETEELGTPQASMVRQPRVRPYFNWSQDGRVKDWFNPRSFQIICAGADNNYGGMWEDVGRRSVNAPAAPHFPLSDNIVGGHSDNQTNFVRGVLEDLTK